MLFSSFINNLLIFIHFIVHIIFYLNKTKIKGIEGVILLQT